MGDEVQEVADELRSVLVTAKVVDPLKCVRSVRRFIEMRIVEAN